MDHAFVKDSLGKPWAKQDSFTTGSGLSIHLAYRIIESMGGNMQIASAPLPGCLVSLEVALIGRNPVGPTLRSAGDSIQSTQRIALIGFDRPDKPVSG
jgi:hypothetical protein